MEPAREKIIPFPPSEAEQWIEEYRQESLGSRDKDTTDAYVRVLRKFTIWMSEQPGHDHQFHPEYITRTLVEIFLDKLPSASYKNQARSALSGFCRWLMEDRQVLSRNPTRGIAIPSQALLAPRQLEEDQRLVLRDLVEREADLRGKAAFALGFWAGCRVSDVSYLLVEYAHLSTKSGWITIGHKDQKTRTIDLLNQVRLPLYEYLYNGDRNKNSPYIFTSQRSDRWTEDGIHYWWQQLKRKARRGEAEIIEDVHFHDLRHDFGHRARDAGWSLEEVAYYLGHITNRGTPAIQTTARYTQVGREQVKKKLKNIKG
jgi:site-specific recombinase XerD